MKNHSEEFSDRQFNSNYLDLPNINQIKSFILENNIDINYVKSLEPENRNIYLLEKLFTFDDIQSSSDRYEATNTNENPDNDDIGMLLIKPEMFPYVEDIERSLSDVGIECRLLERIIPTKQDWLNTYGYMLVNFPNIVNVYVIQRSLGVQPVIFRHLSMEKYTMIADERHIKIDTLDRDKAFDQLFCGKAKSGFEGTIRHDLVLPRLISLGFNDMSGYASDFDPFDYYKDSGSIKTYTSYNGIHSPKDMNEKNKNIQTYVIPR